MLKNSSLPCCHKGSIAILTLWAILFLALLSLSLSSRVAARLLVASDMKWTPKVRAMGAKALADTLTLLDNDKTPYDTLREPWADGTRFKDVPYGGGSYSLIGDGLQDEERKINLNRSPSSVLSRLLQIEGGLSGGLSGSGADELAVTLVDWRDKNTTRDATSLNLPESCADSSPLRCKNDDFEVLEEILWVPGMTVALFQKIKEDLTLYGEGPSNINTATAISLRAVGLSETAASKVIAWRTSGNFFEDFSDLTDRSRELGLDDDDRAKLLSAVSNGLLGVKSDNYQAQVEAKFGGRVRGRLSFIVDRKGEIKLWKE